MNRGLYAGASAMQALARQQELIASNMANMQSNGFRRSLIAFEERENAQKTPLLGTATAAEKLDFSQGFLQQTGRQFDVAISGEGFFSVAGPGGETLYTRAGVFFRNPDGSVVNGDGMPVLNDSGTPLNISPQLAESQIVIDPSGNITAGTDSLGKLGIVEFADNDALIPQGQVYFRAPPNMSSSPATGRVMQGERELSNSNPVNELINLIVTTRLFEASQRSIRTIGETIQQHYRS